MKYLATLEEGWAQHKAKRKKNAPTVISTFAGGGGSSLGYSMAGYKELLAVEWDENAVETLRLNFKGMPVFHGDIATLSVEQCLEMAGIQPGELDVFDGSPPCQGFSTAGKRKFNDNRNSLFREYVRLLKGLKPKAFVMENVAGLVSGKMRVIFSEIMRELKSCGYNVKARLLNAMHFGVPQSRRRIIFIGVRDDLGIEPSHPAPLTRPITCWEAVGHLGNVQDPAMGHVWIDESPKGNNTKTWLKAFKSRQGDKFAGRQQRDRWDRPANTLTTGGTGRMPYVRSIGCHPKFVRTWSTLEFKILATFPLPYRFAGDPCHVYNRVGNSVPPFFMRAIANHVKTSILQRISH